MIKNNLLFIVFSLFISLTFSQTKSQRNKIIKNYDKVKLTKFANELKDLRSRQKIEAIKFAKNNNLEVRYTKGSTTFELQRISKQGNPIYYKTYNRNAAKSTRTNHLHNGGSLGLNLEGQNMTAYVWDSGMARETHQEYDGIGGSNRFSSGGDGASLAGHSAHVMGTIIASGFNNNAKGMAPQANGIGYDWNNDDSEVLIEATNGMLLSNHSYGDQEPLIDDWMFGAYSFEARVWDQIMYDAPYYLMVMAAGNAGQDNTSNGLPLNGNAAFDKLSGHTMSKNGLVVANGRDANVNNDGTLNSVLINSGSSEGPSDDLRIKPDITGNGTFVYSTTQTSNSSYDSFTGTSMASPNVTGSLLLLQQHYNSINQSFMRASTLKGLALHTADDAGINGPDAIFGWGLMNTKIAAETINNNGLESIIYEGTLNQGESYSITVNADGINDLIASVSWTDVPATNYNSGIPNDPTPVLVNDLDIRVDNGTNFEPWKLTGLNTNVKGDNIVDPFERVDVTNANGTYTITITHKGTLENGNQNFALIVTGVASEFTIDTDNVYIEACDNTDAMFNFNFETLNGNTSATSFTAQNVPTGASVVFSPNPISNDGNVVMTVSNLTAVTPGIYDIDVTATNTSESESTTVTLVVYSDSLDAPSLLSPSNNASNIPYSLDLTWNEDFNAQTYQVQIATDSGFNTIVKDEVVSKSKYSAFNLTNNTTHFWRVKPNNFCNSGAFSTVRQFTTAACVSYGDNTSQNIPDAGVNSLVTSINVTDDFTINDLSVFIDITHAEVGSLLIKLTSPANTSAFVLTPVSDCNATNILANFNDGLLPKECDLEGLVAYNGNFEPGAPFSTFNGESTIGTWILDVRDLSPDFIGTLNGWNINFCENATNNLDDNLLSEFSLYPNPTNGDVNISFNSVSPENVKVNLFDMLGRQISNKVYQNQNSTFSRNVNFGNLSTGIYIIQVINGNKKISKKLVIK